MTFLSPLFLAGLSLAAIPVVIHLFTRMRRRTVRLPTVRFLIQAENTTQSRRKLRDILLLLLRCAIVAALVLAFARPTTILSAAGPHPDAPSRRLVLLIDRSGSMQFLDGDRTLFDIAREEAIRLIRSADRGARFTVIAFDDAPDIFATDADIDGAERAVRSIRVTFRGTDAMAALRLADDVPAPRTVVMISDMARHGYRGRYADLSGLAPDMRWIDLSAPGRWNRWIAGARRSRAGGNLDVDLRSMPGADAVAGIRILTAGRVDDVTASVNDIAAGDVQIPIAGDGFVGALTIQHDLLAIDDAFYVQMPARHSRSAGLIAGENGRATLYLNAIGAIDWTDAESIKVRAVVVTDGKIDAHEEKLESFVRRGGTLVVFAPVKAGADGFPWGGAGDGAVERRRLIETADGIRMEIGNHPILADLESELIRAPLAFTRLDDPFPPDCEIIIRYEDGVPCLGLRQIGRGRVFLWNASADASWGDLPLHPIFPILISRLLTESASGQAVGIRVGDAVTFPADLSDGRSVEAIGPDGGTIRGAVRAGAARFGIAEQPGFYKFGSHVLACNVDPEEGDLTPVAPAEILAGVDSRKTSRPPAVERPGGDIGALLNEPPSDPQNFWRWMILLALILAAAELVLSRPAAEQATSIRS